jgi:predicted small lipoprotein YifL
MGTWQKHCSKMAAVLLVVLVTGCGSTMKLYYPPSQASSQPATQASGPAVSIEVLPRLGLFDDLLYRSRADYLARLPADAQVSRFAAPQKKWTAVFPKPKTASECAESNSDPHTLCGNLASRQVILKAEGFGDNSSCTWTLDGKEIKDPKRQCFIETTQLGNARGQGRVVVQLPAGDRTVDFPIPADKLIVVLGDSYASGEGNPDVPLGEPGVRQKSPAEPELVAIDNRAIWMSERCHRSFWAGPMRAGLKMAASSSSVDNGVRISTGGAITVLSAACSGAELADLLIGADPEKGYPGRESRAQMALAHKNRYGWERLPLFSAVGSEWRTLKPQIKEIADLLDTASPNEVDAAIISVGGNDIGFGSIVVSMMEHQGLPSDQARIDQAQKIAKLSADFPKLFDQLEARLRPANVYLMSYPDPTRLTLPASDQAGYGYCHCNAGGFLNISSIDKKFCMDEKENEYASNDIVLRLNRELAATAGRHGWYFVHGLKTDPFLADASADDLSRKIAHALHEFDTHSWCAADDQRWMRTLADSFHLQAEIPGELLLSSGAMHPSANGHEAYMAVLYSAMTERGKPPAIDFTPSAISADGATLFVPGFANVRLTGSSFDPARDTAAYARTVYPDVTAFSRQYGARTLCSGARSSASYHGPDASCSLDASGQALSIDISALANEGPFELELTVRDATLKRFAVKPAARLEVDTVAPSFECSVQLADLKLACDDPAVNTTMFDGAPDLVLTARDDKSGFRRWNCEGAACPADQESEPVMRLPFAAGLAALKLLAVQPVDQVGNGARKNAPLEKIVTLNIKPAVLQASGAGVN